MYDDYDTLLLSLYGSHFRHAMLNDIVHSRALSSANVPEPTGLDRADGERPYGITIAAHNNQSWQRPP